jgi:hypothetical protein
VGVKEQLVAGIGYMLGSQSTVDAYSRAESRIAFRSGPFPSRGAKLLYQPFYLLGTGGGVETALANDQTIEAAIEISGVATQCKFSGADTVTSSFAGVIASDPTVDLPADTDFWARTGVIGSVGQQQAIDRKSAGSNEYWIRSTSASSQVQQAGNMTIPSGGASGNGTTTPAIGVVGKPSKAFPAIAVVTDSIGMGVGDATSVGLTRGMYYGWISRGLKDAPSTGQIYPAILVGRAGGNTSNLLPANAPKRWAMITKYCNVLLIQSGRNEVVSQSLASMQSTLLSLVASGRPFFRHIAVCKVMPSTTSTDSWATAANQTPVAGFEVGGKRDQYNSWLDTKFADGTIDALIDPNPYVEDQSNKSKWVTTGAANYPTTDGTHPSTAVHLLAAPTINAWALTLGALF